MLSLCLILRMGPFPFLPNYKNPCWRTSSGVLRCLPYFHLIGCVKCGSSDLFYRITRHPEVSDLIQKKEPKWIGGGAHHAHCCSFNDYLDMYKSAVDKDIAKNDSSGYYRCVLGDGSPGTLVNNVQWEVIKHPEEAKALNRSEPVFANADLIHHLNPGTKIILMLRNPIDRSWSAYQYFGLTSQKSQEDFHRLTVRSISDFQQCLSQNELRHCVYHSHNNVWPNIYHVHLQEYFRVFPRKQILVLNIESYSKDIRAAMEKVYAFLELVAENGTTGSDENLDIYKKTWKEAAQTCKVHREDLLTLHADNFANEMALIKRQHKEELKQNGSWVGYYTSLSINKGFAPITNSSLCAKLTFTRVERTSSEPFFYSFGVDAINCTSSLKHLCYNLSNVAGPPLSSKTSLAWAEAPDYCTMWTPPLSPLLVARDGIFAIGNFTSNIYTPGALGKSFWINYFLEENTHTIYDEADIFQCGYITLKKPSVQYADCDVKKGYICKPSDTEPEPSNSEETNNTGFYVGVPAGVVAFLGIVGGVVYLCRCTMQKSSPQSSIPTGGHSFTRRIHNETDDNKLQHRITTYSKIDDVKIDDVKVDDGQNNEGFNDQGLAYATICVPPASERSKPVPAPRSLPGYLQMAGNSSNDYDSLQVSDKKEHMSHKNIYETTVGVHADDTYNVTNISGRSQRQLSVPDTYGRLALGRKENKGNRESNFCDSTYDGENDIIPSSSIENPSYERS